MPSSVTAALADPSTLPDVLRNAWDRGDAVMPLPVDDTAALLFETITAAAFSVGSPPAQIELDVPNDTALIVATSGSTGTPKGVALSHSALSASTLASITRLEATSGERFTLALPLHHVAGIQVLLRSWACDTDAEILDSGSAHALAAATGDHVSLVPTQLARLVADAPTSLARWRSILVGGAALDPPLANQAKALGAGIIVSYGMTETAGGCVYDGQPLDGIDVTIVNDRIHIDGPVLCSGYLANGEFVPRAHGPLATQDLGSVNGDGALHVLGRADDVVISGGENVPCAAVANRLGQHPRVHEAVVFGMPSAEWGERVTAAVVPINPDDPPDAAELTSWTRAELPRTWAPRRYVVATSIPRTALGKPDLVALRRLADAG